MASKVRKMQNFMRYYKEETGQKEILMPDLADFAISKGWRIPPAISSRDLLAREFARAAREEIRHDEKTGKPYRANHAYMVKQGNKQLMFWIDIDEAERKPMIKSAYIRREQMVGDGLQLSLDLDHWNSIHPDEEPITVELDLTPDVEWRKNAPDNEKKAS